MKKDRSRVKNSATTITEYGEVEIPFSLCMLLYPYFCLFGKCHVIISTPHNRYREMRSLRIDVPEFTVCAFVAFKVRSMVPW